MSWLGSLESEFGTAVTQTRPPFATQALKSSSERVRFVGQIALAALWLKTVGTRETSIASRRPRAGVRQVDHHPDIVHAPHGLDAQIAQPAVGPLILAVSDVRLAGVGQA